MRQTTRYLAIAVAVQAASSGGCGSTVDPEPDPVCGPYPAQATSPWVLPYAVGSAFPVTQGNCSAAFGHRPEAPASRHAYDFGMPIGTPLIATRDGVVFNLEEQFPDGTGDPAQLNAIQIRHPDDSVSEYAHITQDGALFDIGDTVQQGDTIALSGNSGGSTGPHVHFVVFRRVGDPTSIPITFRNTEPHPNGLIAGRTYTAEPF